MSLVSYILKVCSILKDRNGEADVCLSGGVFANRLMLKESISLLRKEGFNVYWNRLVPSGDSGIALGQAYYGLLRKD